MTDLQSELRPDVPMWVKDAVFYQIFPDRFARSETVSKPTNLSSWDSPPSEQGYHGGDLLGIVEHLDYLSDLGINAIYLTPIFKSACNHRYHTHDYYRVDPLLGGNSALRTLVEQSHQRNIRVVLDGVFNHCSRGFFQFNDILENGPHSPWLDWFAIDDWPLSPYQGDRPANYGSWLGNRALPKFKTDNPQVREFLMQIGEYWISEFDIDGWRLDVPAEITTQGFWEEFRSRVRAKKSDAYLVGEIWQAAPDWVRGDRFDATMNYPFAAATIAFAAGDRVSQSLAHGRGYDPYPGVDAPQFAQRIDQLLKSYAPETTAVQLNLLDSHDAPRVLSLARGDKATVRLATLFQMTYPGAPSIYYGDEIAIAGTKRYNRPHRDQDSRWPFPWHDMQKWDQQMLQYFRQSIALRNTHQVLRHGQYKSLYAMDRIYSFVRYDTSEALLVVLNAGDDDAQVTFDIEDHFSVGAGLHAIFGSAVCTTQNDGQVTLSIEARRGAVLGVISKSGQQT
jgi:cyclomaltodextrinase / maltogenic alpha-amylase / neopullulanase